MLEFAQLRGQHMLGDAADCAPQSAETNRPFHQEKQDLQFPLPESVRIACWNVASAAGSGVQARHSVSHASRAGAVWSSVLVMKSIRLVSPHMSVHMPLP
jgi:hypothetical protein